MRLHRFVILACLALTLPLGKANAAGPQPKLPTVTLAMADKKLVAEVADEEAERETGMMFRKSMADGEGMVFVLDTPQKATFWMKNTLIPLSVAYISPMGMILEIYDMKALDETPVPSKFDTIIYAIEVPQGWFQKNAILPGMDRQGPARSAEAIGIRRGGSTRVEWKSTASIPCR